MGMNDVAAGGFHGLDQIIALDLPPIIRSVLLSKRTDDQIDSITGKIFWRADVQASSKNNYAMPSRVQFSRKDSDQGEAVGLRDPHIFIQQVPEWGNRNGSSNTDCFRHCHSNTKSVEDCHSIFRHGAIGFLLASSAATQHGLTTLMIISKISNLCEVLQLPGGLRLKLAERSFNLGDFRVCHRLKRSGVLPAAIYDVGANVGQFALSAANVWPGIPIFSFEPVPAAFSELEKLVQRYPAICPMPMALGSELGTAVMHVTNQTQSSSILKLHKNHLETYPEIRESETRQVPVSTLAMQLGSLPSPVPRLLKLDVQGFEAEVIRGAGNSLKEFRWILLETSTRPMYEGETLFEKLSDGLEEGGFRFVAPFHIHFSKAGVVGQFDALFERADGPVD